MKEIVMGAPWGLVVLVVGIFGCSGPTADQCPDGQKFAVIGEGEPGCYEACASGTCAGSRMCVSGVCVDPIATPDLGSDPVDLTPDMSAPDAPPDMPELTEIELLCLHSTEIVAGCALEKCTLNAAERASIEAYRERFLNGDQTIEACVDRLERYPESRQWADELAQVECGDDAWHAMVCGEQGLARQCDCAPPTNLGTACTADSECEAGDLTDALCEASFPGGYCVAFYCPAPSSLARLDAYYYAGCGQDDICFVDGRTDAGNESTWGVCLDGCIRHDECRPDYACRVNNYLETQERGLHAVRGCSRRCTSNAQCDDGSGEYRCNTDVGDCEFACQFGGEDYLAFCGQVGGNCVADAATQTDFCVMP